MSSNLRVAIVGAGPAGIYAAVELLTRSKTARVDVYDRLPTPGGLARSGVSPDHGQRRKVMDVYEGIALGTGRYHFHGNIEIGKNVSHEQLLEMHHAVIYACGSASDRALGIEGENLKGSHAATEFVAWYNGHPDYASHEFDLSGERAVVIGNGNVALDVARMLLLGEERLSKTDVADHALKALSESTIKEVVLVGRRGIAQAAFTLPELLELVDLDDIDIEFEDADFSALDSESDIADTNQLLRLRTLKSYQVRPARNQRKKLIFKCLASPLSVTGSNAVEGINLSKNSLTRNEYGRWNALATEETDFIDAQLLIRAVGYKGQPVADLPFDPLLGVMPNDCGRVIVDGASTADKGCYVVGWLKRGPKGVLGTNKGCSKETVNCLLEDWNAGVLKRPLIDIADIDVFLTAQGLHPVNTVGWKRIDNSEKTAGYAQNRPRVKIVDQQLLLAAARG